MWQSRHVAARLTALYPDLTVEILGMTTQGDRILDVTLSKIGGKGLFVKELETALQEGRADIAVHSMKDVPIELPAGFMLAAIGERENPLDAFVSSRYASLDNLPEGACVGTSSLRRESQLRARYPHLRVEPLRGNVQTRLRKLDENQYDAIILAAAGLVRLGLAERIRSLIPASDSLPAVGQGALGIECLSARHDLVELLSPLNHPATADCVSAERAMSRQLGGSCQVPLGGHATLDGEQLTLHGLVAEPDGSRIIRGHIHGLRQDAAQLGQNLGEQLLERGALDILSRLAS